MLKNLFIKDIYRDINGVIQAGQVQDDQVAQELDEYVVTSELSDHLVDLLAHYVKSFDTPTDKMGVWISGFFGSGKSHFLKILSYLFGQRVALGKSPLDYFRGKQLQPEVLRLMESVSRHRGDALLFNIESKTGIGTRSQRQSIVEVFLQVFNAHLGYSNTLWVAEIEHMLAKDARLDAFKQAILRIEGEEWVQVREKLSFRAASFTQAMKDVGYDDESAKSVLKTVQQTFEISPDSFARRMAEYCRQQGPDFRLLFMVDEIGQYIGDDHKLLINLQTVVEDLGTYGQGQIWVMVTSQESIDTVTDVQDDGFSKIQARFRTRVNLSSTNTDDVIKWRILQKTDESTAALRVRYDEQEQSLRNMLSFDTATLKAGFPTSLEFAASYPFQPYQFDLLQKVFEKVRKQGEAGKSLSHGERSLLNAFQEAVQTLDQQSDVGALAPFSQFYDTIETFLDGPVKSTVRRAAERSDLTVLDVQVLKVLYLIKNVPEIPASLHNVTTLMIPHMHAVRRDLEQQIRTSLDRLVLFHLITENADATFTFLSDEEQEINREIASLHLDGAVVERELGKIFFDHIYKSSKFRFAGGRDFDFSKRFDQYTHGVPSHTLTLHVVSDLPRDQAQLLSAQTGTLVMALPAEMIGYQEAIAKSLKIAQFTRKDNRTFTESQRKIIATKRDEIVTFETKAKDLLLKACERATFYVLGQEDTFSGDVDSQVGRAMAKLVANTYTHLGYIHSHVDMNNESKKIIALATIGDEVDTTGPRRNDLALSALSRYLEECERHRTALTVDDLVSHFSAVPYGWMDRDIAGLLAVLFHAGQIKLSHLGTMMTTEDPKFAEKLLRLADRKQILIKLLREIPTDVQSRVRRIVLDHFEQAPVLSDSYESLATFLRGLIETRMAAPLKKITERETRSPVTSSVTFPYPGKAQCRELQTFVSTLLAPTDPERFVQAFLDAAADLEDALEQVQRLENFYLKSPIEQFDRAIVFLEQHHRDWAFVSDHPEILSLKGQLEAILRNESPFGQISHIAQSLIPALEKAFEGVLEGKRASYRPRFDEVTLTLEHLGSLYPEHQDVLGIVAAERGAVEGLKGLMEGETQLSSLGSYLQEADVRLTAAQSQIKQVTEIRYPVASPAGPDGKKSPPASPKETITTLSQISEHVLPQGSLRIESPRQLEAYLELIKRELTSLLRDGIVVIER